MINHLHPHQSLMDSQLQSSSNNYNNNNNRIKVGISSHSRLLAMYHNNRVDIQCKVVLKLSSCTIKPLRLLLQRLLGAHTSHQRREDVLVRYMVQIKLARLRIPLNMDHRNHLQS
jgi:hypothetical protein